VDLLEIVSLLGVSDRPFVPVNNFVSFPSLYLCQLLTQMVEDELVLGDIVIILYEFPFVNYLVRVCWTVDDKLFRRSLY
jgi:hypothetical protein